MTVNANFATWYYNLGMCSFAQANYTKSIRMLKKAVELAPKFYRARFDLCGAYLSNKEY
jgi:hypothetical protein